MKQKNKGITLIALVITIVVLIILAGITISIILGNDGLINKTKLAKEEYNKSAATESINLKITNCEISKYAEAQRMPTLKELAIELEKDNEIQYVNGSQRVASTGDINFNTATSIFTKLKAYPYEFEINSSLQLASIDGIQVSNIPTNDDDTTSGNQVTNVNSIEYVTETSTLISKGATEAKESIELESGIYLLIVSTKISDYDPIINLTGDESIQEITPALSYKGEGSENNSGYHSR